MRKPRFHPSAVVSALSWCVRAALLVAGLGLALTDAGAAVSKERTTQKLFGRWTSATPNGYYLGSDPGGSDVSPKWIAIGAPLSSDRSVAGEGAVQVYNAATGAWVRKILPPVGTGVNAYFGAALAISGDLVAVAARNAATNRGLVFVYNMATGVLVKTLSATDGLPGDSLGYKVAFAGNTVAASSPFNGSGKGAVYIFNASTGLQTAKLTASDGVSGDRLGHGLAMEGNLVAAGVPGDDASRGSVYFFDISNPAVPVEVRKYQPAASVGGDGVGAYLSMHQGKLVAGCQFVGKAFFFNVILNSETQLTVSGSGATFGQSVSINGPLMALGERDANGSVGQVHLYRTFDAAFLSTLVPSNGDSAPQRYGTDVVLNGSSLLVTAAYESTQGTFAGAAYLISPVMEALPYTRVAAKGDFAPGAVDINYNVIGDALINASGETCFTSSLSGAGSNAGRDVGAFSSLLNADRTDLVFKSRDIFSGPVLYGVPSRLSMSDLDTMIGFSTLTGAGINATNNLLVWYKTNVGFGSLLRLGTPVPGLTALAGTSPVGIQEAVTSIAAGSRYFSIACTLKLGVAGTTALNDSGLYSGQIGVSDNGLREGSPSPVPLPAGSFLGQFAPRIGFDIDTQVYSTALTGNLITTANNAAVYSRPYAGTAQVIAQKGDTAVDGTGAALTGATYSSFLGEAPNAGFSGVYRATLAGAASVVTPATNEGLWMLKSDGARRLAFRKGQALAAAGGAKIARIIQYWYAGTGAGNAEVLALVQLSGTGVSAVNDQALVLFQSNYDYNVLMREGDAAPGCGNARIGVISRVEASTWFRGAAIVVSLTGATTTTDQALYSAILYAGNPTTQAILRRPILRLRKGQLFENQPGRVKSISLPSGSVTPWGAGGTGRGAGIAWGGQLAFVVEFENGVRQVVKGNLF